jgi:hypothetical protein
MANVFSPRPPVWFRIVAVLLVLWGLIGCVSLYAHLAYQPDVDPNASDWDRAYFAALPVWLDLVYGVAVVAALAGSVALVARSKLAMPLYVVSLIAVVVQFGYIFLATDIIAVKGVWTTYFPSFILAVALFQLWIARLGLMREWLR